MITLIANKIVRNIGVTQVKRLYEGREMRQNEGKIIICVTLDEVKSTVAIAYNFINKATHIVGL